MVTRKAILIGAPGGENNTTYLNGVNHDLVNVKNFLMSDRGGAWYESEIKVLKNPSWDQVYNRINEVQADYCFVYFSGHGFTDEEERMLCLKDCYFSDDYLLNKCAKQLIVIDACRNYSSSISGIPSLAEGEQWSNFTGSPAREFYDKKIQQSPNGKTIVHATQKGFYSYDDANHGGYFTQSLLYLASKLIVQEKPTYLHIDGILTYVPSVLRKANNYQIPEITFKQGDLKVPFGISIPPFEGLSQKTPITPRPQKPVPNNNNAGGWAALGVVALLIYAAYKGSK